MCPVARRRHGLRRDLNGSALPTLPQSVSRGTWFSRLHWFANCYGLSGCSPPWTDLTEFPRPPGAFTSRLPAGRSPFPPLDMTTTATGLLCWRDFHPQEWQLASVHRITSEQIQDLAALQSAFAAVEAEHQRAERETLRKEVQERTARYLRCLR